MSNILKYLNLKKREEQDNLCSRSFVPPPSLLRAIFQVDIPEDKIEQYIKIYKKNCKELVTKYLDRIYLKRETESRLSEIARQSLNIKKEVEDSIFKTMSKAKETIKKSIYKCLDKSHALLESSLRPKFIWKRNVDSYFKKFVETNLNLAYTAVINVCLNWSQWLIFTDEGQHLINLIISGDNKEKIYGIATLFAYLTQIYITSGYDDGVFRKELFQILPSLEPVLDTFPMLKKPFYKMLAGMLTASGFLWGFSKIMINIYGVPPQFFVDIQKIDSEESIYLGSNDEENK
jgi:uncharacterized protein (UPF0254 family)